MGREREDEAKVRTRGGKMVNDERMGVGCGGVVSVCSADARRGAAGPGGGGGGGSDRAAALCGCCLRRM
ncbi:unnamed protein product [Lampetra fluviatilis]